MRNISRVTVLLVAMAGGSLGLGGAAHAAPVDDGRPSSSVGAARASTVYLSNGDYVHVTNREASAHGWWQKISGSAKLAKVTVCLQKPASGGWANVKCNSGTVGPGSGGSGRRVNVRKACGPQQGPYLWRSSIDVDIVGEVDGPEVAVTQQRGIACAH
ncbi:hypothetical protein [Nocardioides lijunqiniae]|uniref:hypothetical protein n=1 Tax=Nocardioides lijunqiniae TaxID=2760832 RepID=UPI0018787C0E|nr:hypothetical protein [Nocardioides lijunqiniae]